MYQIAGDTHTHSVACQHAYSTITENATCAAIRGHRFMAATDHGPAMEGCPHKWYFISQPQVLPRTLCGVVLLRGCEANVLPDGDVDLSDSILSALDWVIASMHRGDTLMPTGLSPEKYTETWLKIAENPYIDCIGHIGTPDFACDYERVVRALAANGKALEINASSPLSRPGCEPNCHQVIRLCKQYGVKLVLSSDSHFANNIGNVDWAAQAVAAEGYPEEDILNLNYGRMCRWLMDKKGLKLPE